VLMRHLDNECIARLQEASSFLSGSAIEPSEDESFENRWNKEFTNEGRISWIRRKSTF